MTQEEVADRFDLSRTTINTYYQKWYEDKRLSRNLNGSYYVPPRVPLRLIRLISRFSGTVVTFVLLALFGLTLVSGLYSTAFEPFTWLGWYVFLIGLTISLSTFFLATSRLKGPGHASY